MGFTYLASAVEEYVTLDWITRQSGVEVKGVWGEKESTIHVVIREIACAYVWDSAFAPEGVWDTRAVLNFAKLPQLTLFPRKIPV